MPRPSLARGTTEGASTTVRAPAAFHEEFGDYLNRVVKQVDRAWNRGIRERIRSRVGTPAVGATVEVTFVMDRSGRVSIGKVDGDADQLWKKAAVEAITTPTLATGGYGAWTDDMVARLGERQELVFTFKY